MRAASTSPGTSRTSLMRRVKHRMDQAGYRTYEEYLDVLQASADEFAALFNTILINVTGFFRDPCRSDSSR
jgi:two-component system, chemotaxis family, CheB/CheR fusion protein